MATSFVLLTSLRAGVLRRLLLRKMAAPVLAPKKCSGHPAALECSKVVKGAGSLCHSCAQKKTQAEKKEAEKAAAAGGVPPVVEPAAAAPSGDVPPVLPRASALFVFGKATDPQYQQAVLNVFGQRGGLGSLISPSLFS